MDAKVDVGIGEPGALGSEYDVTGHGQFQSPRTSDTVKCDNHWLGEVGKRATLARGELTPKIHREQHTSVCCYENTLNIMEVQAPFEDIVHPSSPQTYTHLYSLYVRYILMASDAIIPQPSASYAA